MRLLGMLEVPDCGLASWSWFCYGPWSLIHLYSKFWHYIWFWSCKEHPCPLSPDLGFRGCWRSLTGVWYLDLDFDMVTGPWYNHDPSFGSLSWFRRSKEHPCPLSPHLGLLRILKLKAPDWCLASVSWFVYGHWSLVHLWSEFWHSILSLKV